MLMFTNDLSQPAADAIAYHGAPNRSRCNKAGAKGDTVLAEEAQYEKPSALSLSLFLHKFEFRGTRQSPIFGKCETFCGHAIRSIVAATVSGGRPNKKKTADEDMGSDNSPVKMKRVQQKPFARFQRTKDFANVRLLRFKDEATCLR